MGYFNYQLNQRTRVKIKKAKKHLKKGHIAFEKKDFKHAIIEYKRGIKDLKWIDIRAKTYEGDRDFLKNINLVQTLWGWLSKAYRELGDELNATKCLEALNHYLNLEKLCIPLFFKEEKRRRERNRKFLPEILFYGGLEGILFIVGFFLAQLLTNRFIFVSLCLFVTMLSSVIYLIFNLQFRRTYSFRYSKKNLRRVLSRYSEYEKSGIEQSIEIVGNFNFFLDILLMVNLFFYPFILVHLETGMTVHSHLAYLTMTIITLVLFFFHGIIFWHTDWYKIKGVCPNYRESLQLREWKKCKMREENGENINP